MASTTGHLALARLLNFSIYDHLSSSEEHQASSVQHLPRDVRQLNASIQRFGLPPFRSMLYVTPTNDSFSHSPTVSNIVDIYPESNYSWFSNTTEFSFETTGSRGVSLYSLSEVILIAIVAGALSLGTVVGNIMVMISFKMDKQLQTISNYFLLSLAIADLWIGLISMPLFTMYTLLGFWPLGPMICDTWLAFDYLNSNASVLNLLIISFDRYFSVTRPLTYRARRTTKRAAFMIACAWVISLVLWPPWIYSWPYIEGQRKVAEGECFIQFLETNLYVTFGTAIAAFYLPVTVMCILYWRIWRETEQRKKDLTHLQAGKKDDSKKSSSSDEQGEGDECQRARSDSCIADKTTYVPTSFCVDPPKQPPIQEKSRPQKVKEAFMTCCKIDRDADGQDDDSTSHGSPGAVTPASAETPIQSSRTTSMTFQACQRRETDIPLTDRNGPRRPESMVGSSTHPSSSCSFSSDAIYTILIRLPTQPSIEGEGESQASIKMILEEDEVEAETSMQLVRASGSLGALAVQRPTNLKVEVQFTPYFGVSTRDNPLTVEHQTYSQTSCKAPCTQEKAKTSRAKTREESSQNFKCYFIGFYCNMDTLQCVSFSKNSVAMCR
ncbi:muscarinic acetylcholine receptor DM1-like [Limulus polyphemus]|uniref:Muscarinic acetylcholine receptor DM1-like n=1 Tax=Limulus polyphemus TaxID=6850 RepID=A0ABM1T053_LIMPO|nr:muscarinic acetylcholine receptor DM1-like [Limulus polyphemus]